MIGDPTIEVACDDCGCVEDFGMTPLARHSWDCRDLGASLKRAAWRNIPEGSDFWFCPDCAPEQEQ